MGIVATLTFLATALYASLALFALATGDGLRTPTLRRFLALMGALALYSLLHVLIFTAPDAAAAWSWFQAAALLLPAILPLQFLLVVGMTGRRLPRPVLTLPLVVLPSLGLVALLLLAGSPGPESLVRTPEGWAREMGALASLGPVMAAIGFGYVLASLSLLVPWALAVRSRRQRKQAAWVVGSGLACVAATVAYLAWNPPGAAPAIPHPVPLLLAVWAVGWAVAIFRYRLMAPTPALAAGPILEAMQDLVLLADEDGRVRMASPRARALLGHEPAALEGRPVESLVKDPEPLRAALASARQAPAGSPPEGCDATVLTPEGQEVPVRLSVTAIRDPEGDPVGLAVVAQDQRPLREMLKSERIESIGLLAGGIAHDFNNLLMAVGGYVSLASLDVPEDSQAGRRLEEAGRAVQRAQGLTRQLLTFSRGGAPVIRATSLMELLRDTAAFVVSGAPVRLSLDIPPDLWWVDADEGQIAQVVHNLALNALQAMPGGGTLRLSARNHPAVAGAPDRVRIEVADTGPGIQPEHLVRIFDPFFTTKPNGTGLGLATVHSIVRRHGGDVAVDSRPGDGTTFRVDLPRARTAVAPLGDPAARTAAPASGRVLVMDDQAAVRRVVAEMLEQLGYEADRCADGAEAVARHAEALRGGRPYDLVLLDLTVPGGMGGEEALAQMRASEPGLKAVVASGYAADAALAEWRRRGFDGVLPKPYTMERLQSVLETARGRARSPWPALTGTEA